MKFSLIIPTLNENESVGELFLRLKQVLFSQDAELIFVDDGSQDGTRLQIENFKNEDGLLVRLIEGQKRGLACAVMQGLSEGRGDVFGVIDADLSHPPELLSAMFELLRDADIVIGSRNLKGGGVQNWTLDRKLLSGFATLLAKPLCRGVSDPMSGFFLIKRSVLDGVELNPCGYKILLEILVKGKYNKVAEVPYVFLNREVGKSKMGWRVMLQYLVHLWRLYWWRGRFRL